MNALLTMFAWLLFGVVALLTLAGISLLWLAGFLVRAFDVLVKR